MTEMMTWVAAGYGTVLLLVAYGIDQFARRAQTAHEKEMAADEGMHMCGGVDGVSVEPGKSAELLFTFAEPGTIFVGCHEPGHYAKGMRLVITVT